MYIVDLNISVSDFRTEFDTPSHIPYYICFCSDSREQDEYCKHCMLTTMKKIKIYDNIRKTSNGEGDDGCPDL